MAPVIDVHTHMLTHEYVSLLEKHGGPTYSLKTVTGGLRAIHLHDAPFMTPVPEMFDYPARIKMMDDGGHRRVGDLAVAAPTSTGAGPRSACRLRAS